MCYYLNVHFQGQTVKMSVVKYVGERSQPLFLPALALNSVTFVPWIVCSVAPYNQSYIWQEALHLSLRFHVSFYSKQTTIHDLHEVY